MADSARRSFGRVTGPAASAIPVAGKARAARPHLPGEEHDARRPPEPGLIGITWVSALCR